MWFFYIFALVPVLVGAFFLWKDDQVNWWEWLAGSAAAFIVAGLMHLCAIWGMTSDTQTVSGRVTKVSHMPAWTERYTEHHSETTTDSKGRSHTRTWTTTEYDRHREKWVAYRNFGQHDDDIEIEYADFADIGHKFGGRLEGDGKQSYSHWDGSCVSGDRNIYSYQNIKNYLEPTTTERTFENKVKAAPTLFSFSKVPTNINVYPWPNNDNWRKSDRLCGTASVLIDLRKWDCLNATIGPHKKVNLIMVGFGKEPMDYGQMQQAKWIGGKKNDLVLCFGGATRNQPAQWAYVFGWTESELVKKNLQSMLLQNPVNDSILPLIYDEVVKNYTIKDWHKFDYITIEPPTWSYWVFFIVLIATQGGLYYFFHVNEYDKENDGVTTRRYGSLRGYNWRRRNL